MSYEFEYRPELSTTPPEEDRNICPECGMYAGTEYDYCIDHRGKVDGQ